MNRLTPLLLALPFVLALGLLVFSLFFLQRAVVVPLANLESATAKISAGRLNERVPLYGPSELRSLADKVNGMANDLAESRQSLLRAEKQATLGSLVPVLAHNIRNPIAAIRATAQMISDPALTPETREDLAGIIAAADRLERWTRSLLSYLHPMKPNFTRVELPRVLDNVLELCRIRIEEKSLTVVRDDGDAGVSVSLDVDLMEQALQGLVVNAIEASPEGGQLTLRVASHNGRVGIHLLDEGFGMPFAPGTTELAPGPTTKRFGTGLGIPFALRVLEEHGGAIQFKTRRPHGTEVVVVIPTHHAREGSADVNE